MTGCEKLFHANEVVTRDSGSTHGNKLDDRSGNTSLEEKLVGEVVGVSSHGRGLPEGDISNDGRSGDEVTTDGSL